MKRRHCAKASYVRIGGPTALPGVVALAAALLFWSAGDSVAAMCNPPGATNVTIEITEDLCVCVGCDATAEVKAFGQLGSTPIIVNLDKVTVPGGGDVDLSTNSLSLTSQNNPAYFTVTGLVASSSIPDTFVAATLAGDGEGPDCVVTMEVTVVAVQYSIDHVCTTAVHSASHEISVNLTPSNISGAGTAMVLELSRQPTIGSKGAAIFTNNNSNTISIITSTNLTVMGTEYSDELTNMVLNAYLSGASSCLCGSNRFTVVDATNLVAWEALHTNNIVNDPTQFDDTNTVYICQTSNNNAELEFRLWWTPSNYSSNEFLWEFVDTNGVAANEWDEKNGDFTMNPTSSTWTATGQTNREFKLRAWFDCDGNTAWNPPPDEEPHRIVDVVVVDVTKMMLTNALCTNAVVDVTRPDEPPSVTNTLLMCEGTNGTAEMGIKLWWLPENVDSNKFLWDIVLTNGMGGATQWNETNGNFTVNPTNVVWTNSASAGGETNREFLVRGWFDCDKDNSFDVDEPHRSLYATVVDFVKLMLTNSVCSNAVVDVTRPDEAASTSNTLYLCEGTNGTAEMDIQGWWLPSNVDSSKFMWELRLTNGVDDVDEWDVQEGTFATNPVSVTWTAGGDTNREFLVRGWYDCDQDGAYTNTEPHRLLYVAIIRVDVDISGVADGDEESVGKVVVRNADTNNAARKQIVLQKAEPSSWAGNLLLARNSTKVRVFTAVTIGSEISFNGNDNKFANSDLPTNLWVQGHQGSTEMRDTSLKLYPENMTNCADTVKFSVLWVTVSGNFSGTMATDNAARKDNPSPYGYWNLANPHTYDLGGPRRFDFPFGTSDRIGRGCEFVGTVSPSNFNQNIIMDRDDAGVDYDQNGQHVAFSNTWSSVIPPGRDRGPAYARDDDPQSGASVGEIYDWDNPGVSAANDATNSVRRQRVNFKESATFNDDGTEVRCSTIYKWHSAQSYKKTGTNSTDWTQLNDVGGDNNCGSGWLNHVTWDMQ